MNNIYAANFIAYYKKFAMVDFESVDDMLEAVCKYSDERHHQLSKIDSNAPIAHVVLGFSGNGKTTYISNHAKEGDRIISVDTITRNIAKSYNVEKVDGNLILDFLGTSIAVAALNHKEMWFDGLWLNIMTRYCLITTLHEYGYQVYIHNLLSDEYVSICQKARVIDECVRLHGENYSKKDLEEVVKMINDYLEMERKTRYVEKQIEGKYMYRYAERRIDVH